MKLPQPDAPAKRDLDHLERLVDEIYKPLRPRKYDRARQRQREKSDLSLRRLAIEAKMAAYRAQ